MTLNDLINFLKKINNGYTTEPPLFIEDLNIFDKYKLVDTSRPCLTLKDAEKYKGDTFVWIEAPSPVEELWLCEDLTTNSNGLVFFKVKGSNYDGWKPSWWIHEHCRRLSGERIGINRCILK